MRKYIFENALENLNCDSITTQFVNFLFDDSNSLICADFVIYELGSCNDVIESAEFLKTLLLDYIEENSKQGVFESFTSYLSTIAIESIDFVKIALLFEGYIGAHNPSVSSLPIDKPINGTEYIENARRASEAADSVFNGEPYSRDDIEELVSFIKHDERYKCDTKEIEDIAIVILWDKYESFIGR